MKGEAEPGAEPRNREPEKNEGEAGGAGPGAREGAGPRRASAASAPRWGGGGGSLHSVLSEK